MVLFAVACAGIVALGALSFETHHRRGTGPDYTDAVRRAATTRCPSPADTVRIQIAPVETPESGLPQWYVTLPCSRLLESRLLGGG